MSKSDSSKLISEIQVGKRHRRDLGDLKALADSIQRVGLLHPIVIWPNGRMIVGERRLKACKLLGWERIPVNMAENLTDAAMLLWAEADENTCRKDFSPDEAVAVGEAIERAVKPEKEKAQREAGGDKKSAKAKSVMGTSRKRSRQETEAATTTAVAAAAVGMDRRTYEKAKEVVSSGDSALIAEMAKSGKVNGAGAT